MVDQLGDEFEFRIVAQDRDFGDCAPFPGMPRNMWVEHGRAHVFYRSPGEGGWRALRSALRSIDIDLIYLNSLFEVSAALRPMLDYRRGSLPRAPVLLAPRGELSPGALGLKPIKKRLFITLVRLLGFYSGVIFQASSAFESQDIQRALGKAKIIVAPNLAPRSSAGASFNAARSRESGLRVVFLSRISAKKNLITAIRILSHVACPVTFDIYGVKEDAAYWQQCEAEIARLPGNVRARFRGSLRPEAVEATLGGYDLFLFPTLGENYGHVIRESLAAGTPVLISDQTPWRDLLLKGAGADLPLSDLTAFADWISAFGNLPSAKRAAMRSAARALGNDVEAMASNREANRQMLYAALATSNS
jgi:glycosyltransferase involved in cell wall biosynthesis